LKPKIIIFGSTGTLGQQTLGVLEEYRNQVEVAALVNNSDQQIHEQAKLWPGAEVFQTGGSAEKIKEIAIQIAKEPDIIVFNLLSGMAGWQLTKELLNTDHTLVLANKESVLAYGKSMAKLVQKGKIIPLDSEHNALHEILKAHPEKKTKKMTIPCSGGPFWQKHLSELEFVTPQEALKHPKWQMGAKISIESATLINKGFEVVEAHLLFDQQFEDIDVIIHPACAIHAIIEFENGETFAYVSKPDMREHIKNALREALGQPVWHPQTRPSPIKKFISELAHEYEIYDLNNTNLLGIQLVVDNFLADPSQMTGFLKKEEMIINQFLAGKIGFLEIYERLLN
jgi:1-deoxy-D-xylulose-5-phosphate reductoisomerase